MHGGSTLLYESIYSADKDASQGNQHLSLQAFVGFSESLPGLQIALSVDGLFLL